MKRYHVVQLMVFIATIAGLWHSGRLRVPYSTAEIAAGRTPDARIVENSGRLCQEILPQERSWNITVEPVAPDGTWSAQCSGATTNFDILLDWDAGSGSLMHLGCACWPVPGMAARPGPSDRAAVEWRDLLAEFVGSGWRGIRAMPAGGSPHSRSFDFCSGQRRLTVSIDRRTGCLLYADVQR